MEIKDYLHLYLGCEFIWEAENDPMILKGVYGDVAYSNEADESGEGMYAIVEIKPILRPLSDMTYSEAVAFAVLCMDSKFHLDQDARVTEEDVDIELAKNDGGNLLDRNIELYIRVSCRCFEGAIVFGKDGSICVEDEDATLQHIDEVGEKVRYLLSKHFDLFDLIPAGLAIDATTLLNKDQGLQECDATEAK